MPILKKTNNKAMLLGMSINYAQKMKLTPAERLVFVSGAQYVIKHLKYYDNETRGTET